jgi:hypothetical protein
LFEDEDELSSCDQRDEDEGKEENLSRDFPVAA